MGFLGQPLADQLELLGDDLPIDVDVGSPVELDPDNRKPDAGRRADAATSLAPFMADSMGNVTSVSTSSGAKPCASVMMVTVGRLRFGKTSIGNCVAWRLP